MKLSVVMPVYNEKDTLVKILRRVKEVDLEKEIIIVDDFSIDGTRNLLKDINDDNVKIFFYEKNKGKNAALKTGFKHVTGDVVIVQDADLEYDPNEYHKLLSPIKKNLADVVYGSRFLGGPHRVFFF